MDFSTLVLTVCAGLFTLYLFYQTCDYIHKRTSLIDDTKRTRKNKDIRQERYYQEKYRPSDEIKVRGEDSNDSEDDPDLAKVSKRPKEL